MQKINNVNEKLLTYYWQNLWFNKQNLFDYFGNAIEILHPGTLNTSSGPDFSECRIKINGLIWVGNVELHVNSSDFIKHKHCSNKNYEALLLHVVWKDDLKNETLLQSRFLATIEMKERVQKMLPKINRNSGIACRAEFLINTEFQLEKWFEKLLQDRWQEKQNKFQILFKEVNGNKELGILCLIAKYLGGNHNGDLMMDLVKRISIPLMRKMQENKSIALEIINGLSGWSSNDNYTYYKKVFNLYEIPKHMWKNSGIYSAGMPQNRLLQLAYLFSLKIKWYDFFLEKNVSEIKNFFSSLEIKFSTSLTERIIINVVLPIKNKEQYSAELKMLKAEKNAIISKIGNQEKENRNAFYSQVFLQLYTKHCSKKKCLDCNFGKFYLKKP